MTAALAVARVPEPVGFARNGGSSSGGRGSGRREGSSSPPASGLTRHVYALYLASNCVGALIALGRWTEAERLLTDALESESSDAAVFGDAYDETGMIAALAGRYDEAARDVAAASGFPREMGAQYGSCRSSSRSHDRRIRTR